MNEGGKVDQREPLYVATMHINWYNFLENNWASSYKVEHAYVLHFKNPTCMYLLLKETLKAMLQDIYKILHGSNICNCKKHHHQNAGKPIVYLQENE